MLGLLVAVLLGSPQEVLPVGGGNALTLPAQRHLVRLDRHDGTAATWLLAVQQDGANGHRLSMYRSDDEARTWSWYAPIQDACCERDTADLLQSGMDVAVVFSYEGPDIFASMEHHVWFQWWRWNGAFDWIPQPAVRVFDSASSSTAYLRGELAIDSLGRPWVWAQRLNADGSFTMVMAVSVDHGATFKEQPSLDTFADRPGGRILAVGGSRLMLLYGTHGVEPGHMRLRNDSDPVSTWGPGQVVFSDGIYHGAALSAATDGNGGVHLLYKDVDAQLWYRSWNGTWSERQLVESSVDWALQPAITRVGDRLVIFWNRALSTNTSYEFYCRVLQNGSLGEPQLLDGSGGFKGYPASVEVLPGTVPQVPCFYGTAPDANSAGSLALVFAPTPTAAPSDAGTPDAGTPDAGTADAGTPDASTADAGTPDASTADAGAADAGTPDAGTPDAGTPDAGTPDAGTPDAGTSDAGIPDAGSRDAGTSDAGTPDAGTADAGTPDAGTPDAGTSDAGTSDAGTSDAGTSDAGTSDAGTSDAGTSDAGTGAGGSALLATVTYTETGFDLLAVDPFGTAYGVNLNGSASDIWTTVDGRSWSARGTVANGGAFETMTALSDGILIADVSASSGHVLVRSSDRGVTWQDVLSTGVFRTLSPHSFAELDGAVFYVEYQVFTGSSTPIQLWKSNDRGVTWFVQYTFEGHRHGHGLMPDPARHALFAFFGDFDDQSGLFRSSDGGASWTAVTAGTQEADIVDGIVLSDGSFFCGQDISYHGSTPDTPQIARIALDGSATHYQQLPSASYSTHAVSSGGYVVGATYEIDNDVSPPGWTSGSLWGSGDGVRWQQLLEVPALSPSDDVRADVYWELATGELVVNVRNASAFGPGGRGYMLLHTTRQ